MKLEPLIIKMGGLENNLELLHLLGSILDILKNLNVNKLILYLNLKTKLIFELVN